ncbi:phage tail protein [Dyella flagellata]|uniref:Microcystin dependent protein n=1 Tax=Dyella flagellata TaxID=1867833 RepID=A0ABQ5X5Z0_9GAMM|nr:tail fiber protein [Dyella flagellata]GLQ86468.1 microcystin dependent protein [Dyella flagellata]
MSDYYLGQIMLTGFGFPPRGFAQCNGQLLPINQNTALFALLGTQYGGNGTVTFALPDLRGRTPVGAGTSADGSWQPAPYVIGEPLGVESVTLLTANLPAHNHSVATSTQNGTTRNPTNSVYGAFANEAIYASAASGLSPLNPAQVQPAGGNQPHNNMQPYLAINFNIALIGIFPARG